MPDASEALMDDVAVPDLVIPAHPTFSEAARVWAKIGFLSFGGPAGQIALMHKELSMSGAGFPRAGFSMR